VIGPDADRAQLGNYSGFGIPTVSILEGIRNKVSPDTEVVHEPGTDFTGFKFPAIPPEHFFHTENGKTEPGLRAEYFNNMGLEGKPLIERIEENIDFNWGGKSPDPAINVDFFSARWTGMLRSPYTGTCTLSLTSGDGVRFYFDGELLLDNWEDRLSTTDYFTVNIEEGKEYGITIEFYENKWGAQAHLGWDIGFEEEENKKILHAVQAAETSDAAVIVTSIIEGEFQDRAHLDLPGYQERLIKAVAHTGTPTVVVLVGGSAVTMGNWLADVQAVVEAWYPGEEGGNAVADVLFGDYNPAGRLPITFPRSVAQLPLYYNYKPSGRGYDYIGMIAIPLFPFGYGLSYTGFEYGNLRFSDEKISPSGTVAITLDVSNTGEMKGDEVVQLYVHDVIGSVSRPVKELKGFTRVTLDPGETETVRFTLTPEELKMLNEDMEWVVEPGEFHVMIGGSSDDIRLDGFFEVTGD